MVGGERRRQREGCDMRRGVEYTWREGVNEEWS
jgi:hypothetical protein